MFPEPKTSASFQEALNSFNILNSAIEFLKVEEKFVSYEVYKQINAVTFIYPIKLENMDDIAFMKARLARMSLFIERLKEENVGKVNIHEYSSTHMRKIGETTPEALSNQVYEVQHQLPDIDEEKVIEAEVCIQRMTDTLKAYGNKFSQIVHIVEGIDINKEPYNPRLHTPVSLFERKEFCLEKIFESNHINAINVLENSEQVAWMRRRLSQVKRFTEYLDDTTNYSIKNPHQYNDNPDQITKTGLIALTDDLWEKLPNSTEEELNEAKRCMEGYEALSRDRCVIS